MTGSAKKSEWEFEEIGLAYCHMRDYRWGLDW
jgi:hypothetical protein